VNRYVFLALCLLGVGLRLAMLAWPVIVDGGEVDIYLADEGIVGLMAKHIGEGREAPVFFYGQHYLGALEAYLAALSFGLFGIGKTTLRLVPAAFSLSLAVLVYRFTYKFYSVAAARWATALVAVGPLYFLQWNLKARGGFIEHLVLVFVIMLGFWRFFLENDRRALVAFGLGLACGVALWVNQLVGAYLAVMGLLLLVRRDDRRGWGALVAGTLLGASLLIGYNVVHPLATFKTLGRKAVVLNRVPVEQRDESWVSKGVGKRLEDLSQGAGKIGLVFGVPPSTSIERLGLEEEVQAGGALTAVRRSLAFLPLLVFGAGCLAALPRWGKGGWDALGSDQLLLAFFAVTVLVGYVSPRYMLAAYPLACVQLGVLVARLRGGTRRLLVGGIAAVVVYNAASWVDGAAWSAVDDGPARRAELLAFLEGRDIDACYSASAMYHVVFASGEKLVIAPLQKDRYPAYDRIVGNAQSICYIFRDDQVHKRQHTALVDVLGERHVGYREDRVAGYNVFWDFQPRSALTPEVM
jgi:4-amino-4-deoxy-L-arabinose transferase-like glycosyltransferase